MIAGFSEYERGVIGVFPRPPEINQSFSNGLLKLVSWWKKKRSPAKQMNFALLTWSMFFIALAITTTYLRYDQRQENLSVLEAEWLDYSEVDVSRWDVLSYSITAILRGKLATTINDEAIKKMSMQEHMPLYIAKELGRQRLVNELIENLAVKNIRGAIHWLHKDIANLMNDGYFRRAEERAKQAIRLMNKYELYNNQLRQELRHAQDLLTHNVLSGLGDVDWRGIIGIYYYDIDELKKYSTEISLEDNIRYYEIAKEYDTYRNEDKLKYYSERRMTWNVFIRDFSQSEKIDEAAFNVILMDIKILGESYESNKDSSIMLDQLVNDSQGFISKYPKSYLVDDVLYYLAVYSAGASKFIVCTKALENLLSNYSMNDFSKLVINDNKSLINTSQEVIASSVYVQICEGWEH